MQADPLQASFSGGEVSPAIYSRPDIEKYRSSLKTARNFILHSQGGASNRPGTKYVSSSKNSTKNCILKEFTFSREQAYMLEIGEQYIRFYTNGARIDNEGTAYEISTPYLEADLRQLKFESSADVIWITHPSYQQRTLTRYGSANWVLETYAPDDGPFMPENVELASSLTASAVTGSNITLTLSAVVDAYIVGLMHFDGDSGSYSMSEEKGKTITQHGSAQLSNSSSKFGGSSLYLPQVAGNDSYTKTLLHLNGDVVDDESSAKTFTNSNVGFSSTIKKFGSYSAFFNGLSSEITTPDHADFAFGSGDFTVDFYAYFTDLSVGMGFLYQGSIASNMQFYWESNRLYLVSTGGTISTKSCAFTPVVGMFYHIAYVRNGNTWLIFINGISQTVTNATDSASMLDCSGNLYIGSLRSDLIGYVMRGYLDEFRISKGIARWTANFTPAVAAYSSGDYITLADSSDWSFGTGDFSVDFQANFSSLSGAQVIAGQYADASNYWFIVKDSSNKLQAKFVSAGSTKADYIFSSAYSFAVGTWYHIEVTRSSTSFYIFVNGTSQTLTATTAISTNNLGDVSAVLTIGQQNSASFFSGYIDEMRVSKGTARHTSGFTAPTSAYTLFSVASNNFLFNALHVGALFKLRHYVEGQTVSQAFGSSTTSSSIRCFTTWRLITHGTWTGKFNIEKSTDDGTTWTVLRSFSSSDDFNANTSGTEGIESNIEPFLIRINMYSYTSGTASIDLTSDPFYQNGIVRVTAFNSVTSVQANVLEDIGSTAATTAWAEGSWSDYRGYPTVTRFYADRIGFAGTPSEPITGWLGQTGNYYSFRRNSPLLDTDAITFNLPTRQLNAITNMIAFKKLIIFTSSSSWSISPISGNALTPTSAQALPEEYYGSSLTDPVVVGNEAVYIESDNETVRNTSYQFSPDAYVGNEINVLAKHLFESYNIVKFAYQRRPNGIIWGLRDDGQLVGVTYLKEQEVIGWHHHDTTGIIIDIAVLSTTTDDQLWVAVQRNNGIFIEILRGRRQFNLAGHVFLDSYKEYISPTSVLSGLDHLANQNVGVLADGVDLAESTTYTVSAAGTLTLPSSLYQLVDVGLTMQADLQLLDLDFPVPGGSMQGTTAKIGGVTLKLVNTRGGYIGPDENNIYKALTYSMLNSANQRVNRATLGATDNFTGKVTVPLGGGSDRAGGVFYRQRQPFPVTISAIIPETNVGGRPAG